MRREHTKVAGTSRLREVALDAACATQDLVHRTPMGLPRATPTLPRLAWRWPFTARAAIREIVATHELELIVADTVIHAVGV